MRICHQTQKNYLSVLIITMIFGLLLTACGGGGGGGGGGGSDPTGTTPTSPTVQKGVFIDSAVEGVIFRTATQSGVTDQNGTFSYLDGEVVSFFIGDIFLGSAVGRSSLTPLDFMNTLDETNPQVTNIARFLQTLDEDSNPDNGIKITTAISNLANGRTISFSISISAFETNSNVLAVLADLTSLLGTPRALIPASTAQAHLRATLGLPNPTPVPPSPTPPNPTPNPVDVFGSLSISGGGASILGRSFIPDFRRTPSQQEFPGVGTAELLSWSNDGGNRKKQRLSFAVFPDGKFLTQFTSETDPSGAFRQVVYQLACSRIFPIPADTEIFGCSRVSVDIPTKTITFNNARLTLLSISPGPTIDEGPIFFTGKLIWQSGGGGGTIITETKIDAGWGHTCVIPPDGTVRCWGSNAFGELGRNPFDPGSPLGSSAVPLQVPGIVEAKSITAGGDVIRGHTCVVLADGAVRCWGYNLSGQLGNGGTTSSFAPSPVIGISTATAVTASSGGGHTCALLSNQSVQCWGKNNFGQLGDGTFFNSTRPVQVAGLANAIAVSAGKTHTCALLSNSTVKCWGSNGIGQLGNSVPDASSSPVSVAGITNATAITSGPDHTCALLSNNTIKCWGLRFMLGNNNEFSGSTPVLVREIVTATAISAGGGFANLAHTCALLSNGTVRCWGADTLPGFPGVLGNPIDDGGIPARPIPGLTNAAAVATGGDHACALLSNGTVQCWGANGLGQTGGGGIITF